MFSKIACGATQAQRTDVNRDLISSMTSKYSRYLLFATIAATGMLLLAACGKKPDVNTELDRAAKSMQADAAPASAAPAAAQPSQPAPATAPAVATQAAAPAEQMNQAMVSYKSGNFEDAVTRLQRLRAQGATTAQQTLALQDAMAAVVNDLAARAAKGDMRAKAALKQYEALQNAPPR